MESLPLELQEEIFSYLFPHIHRTGVTAVPVSSNLERTNIYNLRLTSRRINTDASESFVRVIEDLPTECRQSSLHNLAKLVALDDVGKHISCLAFTICKLRIEEHQKLTAFQRDPVKKPFEQDGWAVSRLQGELVQILSRTPRLRHLICLPQAVCGSRLLELGDWKMTALEQVAKAIPDPMQHIQEALISTKLDKTLETLTVWMASFKGLLDEGTSPVAREPLYLPQLKHLTLSPSYYELSGFRIFCPSLLSLHVVLDGRGYELDMRSAQGQIFPNLRPGLREYTLSARGEYIATSFLLESIALATKLSVLTISDMILVTDINDDVPRLPDHVRFQELVFANVQHCFEDAITLDGPSTPIELDKRWKALTPLCERAERVRLRTGSIERLLEKSEWE